LERGKKEENNTQERSCKDIEERARKKNAAKKVVMFWLGAGEQNRSDRQTTYGE